MTTIEHTYHLPTSHYPCIEAYSNDESKRGIPYKSKLSEADPETVTVGEGSLVSGGEAVGRLVDADKRDEAPEEQGHGMVKIENDTGEGGIHEWNEGTGGIRADAGEDRELKDEK